MNVLYISILRTNKSISKHTEWSTILNYSKLLVKVTTLIQLISRSTQPIISDIDNLTITNDQQIYNTQYHI